MSILVLAFALDHFSEIQSLDTYLVQNLQKYLTVLIFFTAFQHLLRNSSENQCLKKTESGPSRRPAYTSSNCSKFQGVFESCHFYIDLLKLRKFHAILFSRSIQRLTSCLKLSSKTWQQLQAVKFGTSLSSTLILNAAEISSILLSFHFKVISNNS